MLASPLVVERGRPRRQFMLCFVAGLRGGAGCFSLGVDRPSSIVSAYRHSQGRFLAVSISIATRESLLIGRSLSERVASQPERVIKWLEDEQLWVCRLGGKGNPVICAPEKWKLDAFLDRVEALERRQEKLNRAGQ